MNFLLFVYAVMSSQRSLCLYFVHAECAAVSRACDLLPGVNATTARLVAPSSSLGGSKRVGALEDSIKCGMREHVLTRADLPFLRDDGFAQLVQKRVTFLRHAHSTYQAA